MDYDKFKEHLEKSGITNKEFSDNILKGKNSRTVNNYIGKEVPSYYETLALFLSAFHQLNIPYQNILNGTFFENIDKYKSPIPVDEIKLELSQDEIRKIKELLKNFK